MSSAGHPDKGAGGIPLPSPPAMLELMSKSSIGVIHTDWQGNILHCSGFIAQLLGDTARISPRILLRFVHPDDYSDVLAAIEALRGGEVPEVVNYVSRIRGQDGSYLWVAGYSVQQRDPRDKAVGWLNFVFDLPQSALLEERALLSAAGAEKRYRALFDHSSDAMMLVHGGIIVDCNSAAEKLFRSNRDKLLGLALRPLIEPLSRQLELLQESQARQTLEQNSTLRFQSQIRPPSADQLVDVEVTIALLLLGTERFQLATLRDISEQLAAEAELRRANHALAMQSNDREWLRRSTEVIHAQTDLLSLGRAVVACLHAHYSAPRVHFSLAEHGQLRVIATSLPQDRELEGQVFSAGLVINRALASPDRIAVITDLERELVDTPERAIGLRMRGVEVMLLIALPADDGTLQGVLSLEYNEAASYHAADIPSLRVFSGTLAQVVTKTRSRAALEYQARHDTLTGLYNRAVLHEQFHSWLANGSRGGAALFLLDLDHFKEINDTLGHHVGDDLLTQIGGRLTAGLGGRPAVICRLGGDEFAALVMGPEADATPALSIANGLLAAIRQPFLVKGVRLEISASIGVAVYPQHGQDSHQLLRSADVAMYAAKRAGAGALAYDTGQDRHTRERLGMIVDLGGAILRRELLLHYQPRLNLHSGIMGTCEALVRWQHPQLGLLLPEQFIPLAEMGDTIHSLTANVVDETLQQQNRWRTGGLHLNLAINLSARNLIDDRIVRQLETALGDRTLDPARIELEITETALMQDPVRAIALLRQLAALGVRIAVDDFGTGYSSLNYLAKLPINALKIDRDFVEDLPWDRRKQVIVRSITSLGHDLGLCVVAEGVESAAILDRLREMGVDEAQGYHICKPLPANELRHWLASGGQFGH